MNIFKTSLFTQGLFSSSEPAAVDYGPTYGNRVAAEKALRERWERERDLLKFNPLGDRVEACGGCA